MVGWLGAGWRYRRQLTITGSSGAGTNYVVFIKAYYASGTDGTEALTGGHNGVTAGKLYCGGECKSDFRDLRFTSSDGITVLDYFIDNKTIGVSALFAVEVADSLNSDQTVYVYFGNDSVASLSSAANTFRRVISSGVVLALPMNEGAGNLTDYSGNSNTGTVTGASWVTTGRWGTALSFDGLGDKVVFSDSPSLQLAAGFSSVSYVKLAALGIQQGIISKTNFTADPNGVGYYIRIGADNKPISYLYGAAVTTVNSSTAWLINAQHTLGFTYPDAVNHARFTLDGAWDGVGAAVNTNPIGTGNQPLHIGENTAGTWDTNGVISGLFVFNTALSLAEHADFHNYYPQCSTANLGSLYLRSFVNPEPQPARWGTTVEGEAPVFINARTQWIRDYRRKHLPEMKLLTGLLEYYKKQREENKT